MFQLLQKISFVGTSSFSNRLPTINFATFKGKIKQNDKSWKKTLTWDFAKIKQRRYSKNLVLCPFAIFKVFFQFRDKNREGR